jgi:type II secretory pathway predicted ATPase ExeA
MDEAVTGTFKPNEHLPDALGTAQYSARNHVILGTSQQTLVKRLPSALEEADAVAVIAGRPGIGKTTLVLAAFEAKTNVRFLAHILTVPRTIGELLRALLSVAADDCTELTEAQLINRWRRVVETERSKERPIVVLVENAQFWCLDALRSLDALTTQGMNDAPDANIVLTGTPALLKTLNQDPLEPLRERIQLSATVEPMCSATMRNFLEARIRHAEINSGVLFNPGAAELIYAFSGGIPTIAGRICDAAVVMTTALEEQNVSSMIIRQVADRMSADRMHPFVGRLRSNLNQYANLQAPPQNNRLPHRLRGSTRG